MKKTFNQLMETQSFRDIFKTYTIDKMQLTSEQRQMVQDLIAESFHAGREQVFDKLDEVLVKWAA